MARWERGDRLGGRFLIKGKIAAGGMAEVYLADMLLARQLRRQVALKRIHPHLAASPEFVSMFLDEAKVSSQLVHPGIIPVLDVVEHRGDIFLVLEYVPGWDLSELLRTAKARSIPIVAATQVARSLAMTLSAVHKACGSNGQPLNIIHRDVSPSNILIAEDGTLRLLDFGVAKAAARITRTPTNTLKGKFGYMAPELIRVRSFDHRVDIYALGLVLYEMVTGRKAIDGPNEVVRLERARSPRPFNATSACPEIPLPLNALIMSMTAFEPDHRPSDADAVAAILEQIITEFGGTTAGEEALRSFVSATMGASSRPVSTASSELEVALAKAIGLTSLFEGGLTRQSDPDPSETSAGGENIVGNRTPSKDGQVTEDRIPENKTAARSNRRLLPLFIAIVVITAGLGGVGLLFTSFGSTQGAVGPEPNDAAPPVPLRKGFLRISSEPPGARVRVNEKEWLEPTPTIVEAIAEAPLKVGIELLDHTAVTREVSLEPGRTTKIHIKLERSPGQLIVRSTPSEASVKVDGQDRGKTPLILDDLPRKSSEVEVRLDGYRAHREVARLDKRSEVIIDTTLERIEPFGLLDISSQPWAQVKINGRLVSESTPAMGIKLRAGSYTVTLTNPRLKLTKQRRVTVRAGRRTKLVVKLQ